MRRLPFLPGGRSRTRLPLGFGAILPALIGDLLIWSGIVHRELNLDALERRADRKRKARFGRAQRWARGGAA